LRHLTILHACLQRVCQDDNSRPRRFDSEAAPESKSPGHKVLARVLLPETTPWICFRSPINSKAGRPSHTLQHANALSRAWDVILPAPRPGFARSNGTGANGTTFSPLFCSLLEHEIDARGLYLCCSRSFHTISHSAEVPTEVAFARD
jgi:hypothetical protein